MMLDETLVPAVLTQPAKRKTNSCSSYSASGSSSSDSHSSDSESSMSHNSSSANNSSKSDCEERNGNTGLTRRSVLGLRTRPPKRVRIQSSDSDNEFCDKQSNGSDYVASESEKSEVEEDNFSATESVESMCSDEYLPKKKTKTTARRTKQKSAKVFVSGGRSVVICVLWNQVWDSDPDTYGVWRSSRTRKLPSRYVADNDSDSDYGGRPRKSNHRRYKLSLLVD